MVTTVVSAAARSTVVATLRFELQRRRSPPRASSTTVSVSVADRHEADVRCRSRPAGDRVAAGARDERVGSRARPTAVVAEPADEGVRRSRCPSACRCRALGIDALEFPRRPGRLDQDGPFALASPPSSSSSSSRRCVDNRSEVEGQPRPSPRTRHLDDRVGLGRAAGPRTRTRRCPDRRRGLSLPAPPDRACRARHRRSRVVADVADRGVARAGSRASTCPRAGRRRCRCHRHRRAR